MPIFEYVCEGCKHEFETLLYGDHKAECPKCHGKKLAPQLSVFSMSSKSASSKSMSSKSVSGGALEASSSGPCGSCGDVRGAGACSMLDFD